MHEKRKCAACGEVKPIDEFHRDRSQKGGRKYRCKVCGNADSKRYRDSLTPEGKEAWRERRRVSGMSEEELAQTRIRQREQKMRARDEMSSKERESANALRRSDEARKKKDRESYRRRVDKDPRKRKANWAVFVAVRDGVLVRPETCEGCGNSGKLHGHHWNYDEEHWLDVEWLCTKCHGKRHQKWELCKAIREEG